MPARGGLQAGHRRLRHRLLGTELPAYLPGGSGEDRSLLRTDNEQDRLLLDGIINIVHNLGMQVVIEGETREQLNFLCQKGCAFPGVSAQPPAALRRSDRYLEPQPSGMNLANPTVS